MTSINTEDPRDVAFPTPLDLEDWKLDNKDKWVDTMTTNQQAKKPQSDEPDNAFSEDLEQVFKEIRIEFDDPNVADLLIRQLKKCIGEDEVVTFNAGMEKGVAAERERVLELLTQLDEKFGDVKAQKAWEELPSFNKELKDKLQGLSVRFGFHTALDAVRRALSEGGQG